MAQALGETPWPNAVALANHQLDFIRTNQLDETLTRALDGRMPADLAAKPVRLAILSSSTTAHLHAAIRVAGPAPQFACDRSTRSITASIGRN